MSHIAFGRWRASGSDAEPFVSVGARAAVFVGAAGDYKPLKATPNLITPGDLDSYIALLDPLIKSLDADRAEQIVYNDPAVLEAEAALLTSDYGPVKFVREKLQAEAAVLRKRMVGKSAEQVASEIGWGGDWRLFLNQWEIDKKNIGGAIFLTTGGDWSRLQGDDLNFQKLRGRFNALGAKASRELPEPELDAPSVTSAVPWWAWALGGVVVVGGIAVVASR